MKIAISLQIYLYLPGELIRVSPVLIVSAFPMAQNIAFPLALAFPNHLLSSHFYDEKQQLKAFYAETKGRQSHFRTVLRYLNYRMLPKSGCDRTVLSSILHDKSTPNPAAILGLKSIFGEGLSSNISK